MPIKKVKQQVKDLVSKVLSNDPKQLAMPNPHNGHRRNKQKRYEALYNNVQKLYEQAKRVWKDVVFEILLEPLDPEAGDVPQRHTIDFRDCIPDFEGVHNGQPLPLNKLFSEIERLQDYKKLLRSAYHAIDSLKQKYKDKFKVTFMRIVQHSDDDDDDSEWETETESVSETDSESQTDSEWDSQSEYEESDDSGQETESGLQSDSPAKSQSENESDWELDSGLHTLNSDITDRYTDSESDQESELIPNFNAEAKLMPAIKDHYPKLVLPSCSMVILGPNETKLPRWTFEVIQWIDAFDTTSALLSAIFGEHVLATHGFKSPWLVYQGLDASGKQLNSKAIKDIGFLVCFEFKISEQELHNMIATKCTDARNTMQGLPATSSTTN